MLPSVQRRWLQTKSKMVVSVALPRDLFIEAKRTAIEDGLSFSELVKKLLTEYIRAKGKKYGIPRL